MTEVENSTPPKLITEIDSKEKICHDILLTNNEVDVGVTEFILPDNKGFQGLIKKRFSDFLVNEVTLSGDIVYINTEEYNSSLTLISAKAAKKAKVSETSSVTTSVSCSNSGEAPKSDVAEKVPIEKIDVSFLKDLNRYFECAEWEELSKALEEMITSKGKSHREGIVIPTPIEEKSKRSEMHQFVRTCANGMLDTTTLDDNKIRFKFSSKKGSTKRKTRDEARELPFIHFTLYKENRDTMDALNFISKVLRANMKQFGFAGTKDKRGITTQRISAQRIDQNRLLGLNKTLRGIKLSSFNFQAEPLRLGDLSGNFFTVIIRNLEVPDNSSPENMIHDTLDNFSKAPGFINYYGMQRFGTNSVPTHHIGLALLKSDWSRAVDLILNPRLGDGYEVNKARELWVQTRDAAKCLPLFPSYLVAENAILSTFIKLQDTKNCLEAIKRIPRSLRLLYVHAYQSYVWNKAVSERLKLFGLSPVLGDLVLEKSSARPLVEEELSKFSISQVVFPLPGHSVKYPIYSAIGDIYEKIMSEDGLDPKKMRRQETDYSLPGDYRTFIAHPEKLSWKFTKYSDPDEELVFPDDASMNDTTDGSLLAVRLKFLLPASSYATMLLREIMKVRTEKAFMSLN